MPIHDWTRVNAGLFHHFHQAWIVSLSNALNGGTLPDGYFALAEQVAGGPIPDVLTLQQRDSDHPSEGGTAVSVKPPQTRFVYRAESERYAEKASRLTIRHSLGDIVAIIEIISPGNKGTVRSVRNFVDKAVTFVKQGIHLLFIDLFPPSSRDPNGLHQRIWEELDDQAYLPPTGKPLTLVSYDATPTVTAYVEPLAIGDPLPLMPLFFAEGRYVEVDLEATYAETWRMCPGPLRAAVSGTA
jgi:hypothetical protein